jgi:hypothetical protein
VSGQPTIRTGILTQKSIAMGPTIVKAKIKINFYKNSPPKNAKNSESRVFFSQMTRLGIHFYGI